jgi:hypothetical protein
LDARCTLQYLGVFYRIVRRQQQGPAAFNKTTKETVQFEYGDRSGKGCREGTGAADGRRLFCGILVVFVKTSVEYGGSFRCKKQQVTQAQSFLRQQQVMDAD